MGEVMDKIGTVRRIGGLDYEAQAATHKNDPCVGCSGYGDLLCSNLPACNDGYHDIIWVPHVAHVPANAYEGMAESLIAQFPPDTTAPAAPVIVDETELRDLWKQAYIAAIGTDTTPFSSGKFAVEDYIRARSEGIV